MCMTPPTALTPLKERKPLLLRKAIAAKLKRKPDSEYRAENRFPKRSAERRIRAREHTNAGAAPYVYRSTTVTIFGRPSFAPGIPMENGRTASSHERTRETEVRSARAVSFFGSVLILAPFSYGCIIAYLSGQSVLFFIRAAKMPEIPENSLERHGKDTFGKIL